MKTQVALVAGAALLSACAYLQPEKVGQSEGREYTVTVRNTLAKERFAPILIVGDADDGEVGPAERAVLELPALDQLELGVLVVIHRRRPNGLAVEVGGRA